LALLPQYQNRTEEQEKQEEQQQQQMHSKILFILSECFSFQVMLITIAQADLFISNHSNEKLPILVTSGYNYEFIKQKSHDRSEYTTHCTTVKLSSK
jgi:heme/copper-type cytochrome/quinol oxidase subunit 3